MCQTTSSDTEGVGIKETETIMDEVVEKELGIKELQELIGALIELTSEIKDQSEDGKLSIGELLADLPEAYRVIEEGKDVKEIMKEIENLDEAEAKDVIIDLTTFVFQVLAIIKNLKG